MAGESERKIPEFAMFRHKGNIVSFKFFARITLFLMNCVPCFATEALLLEADRMQTECLAVAQESFGALMSTMSDNELTRAQLLKKWNELFFATQKIWEEREARLQDLRQKIKILNEQLEMLETASPRRYVFATVTGGASMFPTWSPEIHLGLRARYPFAAWAPFAYARLGYPGLLSFGLGTDIVIW